MLNNKPNSQSNKKSKIAIIIAIIAVIGIIFAICSSSSNAKTENKIKAAVATSWQQNGKDTSPEFFTAIEKRSSFKIKKIKNDKHGHYTVVADVTSPDILNELTAYQKSVSTKVSKKEIDKKLTSIINNSKLKTTEQTITVIKISSTKYTVEFSDGFTNAMFGYAYSYCLDEFSHVVTA